MKSFDYMDLAVEYTWDNSPLAEADIQGGNAIPYVAYSATLRTGKEPRGARRVGALCAARLQAGVETRAIGRVNHIRHPIHVRAGCDCAVAALRARHSY